MDLVTLQIWKLQLVKGVPGRWDKLSVSSRDFCLLAMQPWAGYFPSLTLTEVVVIMLPRTDVRNKVDGT